MLALAMGARHEYAECSPLLVRHAVEALTLGHHCLHDGECRGERRRAQDEGAARSGPSEGEASAGGRGQKHPHGVSRGGLCVSAPLGCCAMCSTTVVAGVRLQLRTQGVLPCGQSMKVHKIRQSYRFCEG